MAASLTQIIYAEYQRSSCYPFSEIYFNHGLTIFFENSVLAELVPKIQADKISICSWKLDQKLRWYIGRPRPITLELLDSDYEVMTFTRNTDEHNMFGAAERWHPGFLKTFDMILEAIGVKRPMKIKIPIYQNHFSAKKDIYRDYVSKYLSPAMDVMTNVPEIHVECMKDSNYSTLDRKDYSFLKDKIGVGYVPMATFLLERLFSVYCQNTGVKITYL